MTIVSKLSAVNSYTSSDLSYKANTDSAVAVRMSTTCSDEYFRAIIVRRKVFICNRSYRLQYSSKILPIFILFYVHELRNIENTHTQVAGASEGRSCAQMYAQ